MPGFFGQFFWNIRKDRKTQMMVGVVCIVVIGVIGIGYAFSRNEGTNISGNIFPTFGDEEKNVSVQTEGPRKIDGITVQAGKENLPPVGIMIDNIVTARPQAGISKAQRVYESLAEGGITRFMAIFASDEDISEIGPVRSARSYFVDWADELKSVFMHAGGSPQALKLIPTTTVIDVNQIGGDASYFVRSKKFAAPHNLFTGSKLITLALRDKKAPEQGGYDSWLFKEESTKDDRPLEEKKIKIDFSTFSYKVEYRYDRESNDYTRWNGGEEHKDRLTDQQIRAKNIIVQFTKTGLLESDSGRLKVDTIGEGRALIFEDGKAITGTWKKSDADPRTYFYNEKEEEIRLNPGTTWVEVLPSDRDVIYDQ